jgi:hypothetical protein
MWQRQLAPFTLGYQALDYQLIKYDGVASRQSTRYRDVLARWFAMRTVGIKQDPRRSYWGQSQSDSASRSMIGFPQHTGH